MPGEGSMQDGVRDGGAGDAGECGMRLFKRLGAPATALGLFAMLAPVSGAAASTPAPTKLSAASASVGATAIAVTGTADFGGTAPLVMAEDGTGDAPGGAAGAAAGIDLTSATAYVEDGDKDVATFAFNLAQFDRPPPPEGIRYYWEFSVGGAEYSLQAKLTDFAATNFPEDPQGFAARAGNIFRLRGNCGSLTPVITVGNCSHVAWLTGSFDVAAKQVRVNLPLDLTAAPAIRPGAAIAPDSTANSIWAAFQAVLDNGNTRDSVNQTETWNIPTRTASAKLVDGSGATVRTATLSVGSGGALSGSISRAGLAAGAYAVQVTACFGTNCATQSVPVEL